MLSELPGYQAALGSRFEKLSERGYIFCDVHRLEHNLKHVLKGLEGVVIKGFVASPRKIDGLLWYLVPAVLTQV